MESSYTIEERDFPEMTVLSVKTKDSLKAMGTYIKGLYEQAAERGLKASGPLFTVYFEKPTDPRMSSTRCSCPSRGLPRSSTSSPTWAAIPASTSG